MLMFELAEVAVAVVIRTDDGDLCLRKAGIQEIADRVDRVVDVREDSKADGSGLLMCRGHGKFLLEKAITALDGRERQHCRRR